MTTIAEMKDRVQEKTAVMVMLTVATGGLYPLLWLQRTAPILEAVTGAKTLTRTYLIWIAVCIGLGNAFMRASDDGVVGLGVLISLAANVLYIVWAFRAKRAIEEYALQHFKIDLRMNSFYTFALNTFYINYTINALPEADRRQRILAGEQAL